LKSYHGKALKDKQFQTVVMKRGGGDSSRKDKFSAGWKISLRREIGKEKEIGGFTNTNILFFYHGTLTRKRKN
jgi:hypothetical protein